MRLAPDRQSTMDRQNGRFAMLGGDAPRLEQAGRRLIAADAGDVDRYKYVVRRATGKAVGRTRFQSSPRRVYFHRSYPGAAEPPRFLDLRVNQLLNRPADGK